MTTEELDEIVSRLRRTAIDTDWRTVIRRIAELIDRGECENVYDENEMGACDNGFECSVCGCRVEDEEHYHVSGTWNFCPQCGKRVRPKNE